MMTSKGKHSKPDSKTSHHKHSSRVHDKENQHPNKATKPSTLKDNKVLSNGKTMPVLSKKIGLTQPTINSTSQQQQ